MWGDEGRKERERGGRWTKGEGWWGEGGAEGFIKTCPFSGLADSSAKPPSSAVYYKDWDNGQTPLFLLCVCVCVCVCV